MVKNKFLFKQRSMARWLLSLGMLCLLFGVPESGWANSGWQKGTHFTFRSSGNNWQIQKSTDALSLSHPGVQLRLRYADCNNFDGGVFSSLFLIISVETKSSSQDPYTYTINTKNLGFIEFKKDCSFDDYEDFADNQTYNTVEFGKTTDYYGVHGYVSRSQAYRGNHEQGVNDGDTYCINFDILFDRMPSDASKVTVYLSGQWYDGSISQLISESNSKLQFNANFDFTCPSNPSDFIRTGNNTLSYKGKVDNLGSEENEISVDLFGESPKLNSELPTSLATSSVYKGGAATIDLKFDIDNTLCYHDVYPVVKNIQSKRTFKFQNSKTVTVDQCVFKKLSKIDISSLLKPLKLQVSDQDVTRKYVKLLWEAENDANKTYDTNGHWNIYRSDGDYIEKIGETQQDNREFIDKNITNDGNVDELKFNTSYKYTVCFIPDGWDFESFDELSNLYTSTTHVLRRNFSFGTAMGEGKTLYTESKDKETKITLHWAHSAISDASATKPYTLYLERSSESDKDNWTSLQDINITSSSTKDGSYVDEESGLELYETYYYRLRIHVQDSDAVSPIFEGALKGTSEIVGFKASRGTYTNRVKLQWNVEQVGDNKSYFVLSRRPLGSSDETEEDFMEIYTTSGVDDVYSYDDETANPGSYYEYNLKLYAIHDGKQRGVKNAKADGYCIQTGVLSGRVYYGSGTSVEGVKVLLKTCDVDGDLKSPFRSIDLSNDASSIKYNAGNNGMKKLFAKDFSVQTYIYPLEKLSEDEYQTVYSPVKSMSVLLKAVNVGGQLQNEVVYKVGSEFINTGLYLDNDKWSHITTSYNSKTKTLSTILFVENPQSDNVPMLLTNDIESVTISVGEDDEVITVGSPIESTKHFTGKVDEFRVWTKALSADEAQKNYFHTLSGTETGLAVYWPMDEALDNQVIAYDLSLTNGIANERHAIVTLASSDNSVPSESWLSISAVTDSNGNYVLRGVPFSGNGTNYAVTPIMGVHEFLPSSTSSYVSSSSLIHSGLNFTDVSSFPASGSVFYEGTTIPVVGANICVDGVVAAKEGQPVTTDDNGEFTVDVPIGDHYISISQNGHTFVSEGRFPADPNKLGLRHTFESETTGLTFYDNTLVPVAGRVAGGDVEYEKPLGVGAGNANIGQAKITLDFVGNERYYINAKQVQNGLSYSWDINDERRTYSEASDSISSQVYVEGGKNQITIYTDPETGEWSAMVPPLNYEAASITVPSQPDIDFSSKLFVLDATNPLMSTTDSIESSQEGLADGLARFKYCAAAKVEYKAVSNIEVTENEDGSFGSDSIKALDADNIENTVKVNTYNIDEDGKINYTFGAPVYNQAYEYTYNIFAYEKYANMDDIDDVKYEYVPLSNAPVTIKNEFAGSTSVYMSDGSVYEVSGNTFELDSLGRASYSFIAGFPNIAPDSDHTRNLTISYNNAGTEMQWEGNANFKAIVLGSLSKGNNFITRGPDRIITVLRDPPGSNSSATFSHGTSITKSHSRIFSRHSNTELLTTEMFGKDITTSNGIGVAVLSEIKSCIDVETGFAVEYEENHGETRSATLTLSQDISTSDSPDYVGADGDIFIGYSTNIKFGAVTNLGAYRHSDGTCELVCEEALGVGEEMTTTFNYTQSYIENRLIPEIEGLRNDCLEYYDDPSVIESLQPYNDKPRYITNLKQGDKGYGTSNSDSEVWKDKAIQFPKDKPANGRVVGPSYTIILPKNELVSYVDTIESYNNFIKGWTDELLKNEQCKYLCKSGKWEQIYSKTVKDKKEKLLEEDEYDFNVDPSIIDICKENISFDAGSTVSRSYDFTTEKDSTEQKVYNYNWHASGVTGFTVNGFGMTIRASEDAGMTYDNTDELIKTETKAYSFTLSEDAPDYLSVDVYYPTPGSCGPIFVTRAGATSAPYEDEVVAKYYVTDDGTEGYVLQEKTLQIEKPDLSILNPIVTGVPSGKVASFNVVLTNISESNDDVRYGLKVVAENNPDGAQVYMDGHNLATGVELLVPSGESITKMIQLRQSNEDILDYKDIVIRMYSLSQPDDIYSDKTVTVQFQPSCTDIDLAATTSLVNTNSEDPIIFSMSGYDYNQASFERIRLQYKGENDANFKNLQEFVKDEKLAENDPNLKVFKALSGTEKLTHSVDLTSSDYTDQTYIFRAQTVGVRGGQEVTSESEEIRVVRDMSRPQLITNPTPTSGILTSGDNITLTFNEDVQNNILSKTSNFVVNAVMNETKVEHEVAIDLTEGSEARTTSAINLANHPFSADMWINYSADGRLLQHGSNGNCFTASIRDGKLVISIDGDEIVSNETLPKDKWIFLAMSYDNSGNTPKINVSYAKDAEIVTLFNDQDAAVYTGNGSLAFGGDSFAGHIQEVSLWDDARSISDALADRDITKNQFTSGLIGYWQMNEGHGTVASDRSRSRDLTLPGENSWWVNSGTNYVVKLDGETAVESTISTNATKDDSYMVELWFDAPANTSAGSVQTILSLGNHVNIGLNERGYAVVDIDGTTTTALSQNLCDGQWHHLAFNVQKGNNGSAILYIDGNRCRQFSDTAIPGLNAANHIVLGARCFADGNNHGFERFMLGYVDELRVWNGRRTADVIKNMMFQRVANDADGLEGYFPMETRSLDEFSQIVTSPSATEMVRGAESNYKLTAVKNGVSGEATFTSETAPSLKTAPALENVQFNYVASERQVTINLTEQPYKIENCTINLTLKNVKDINGNSAQPITWSVFVKQNQLKWAESSVSVESVNGKSANFSVKIENTGSANEGWTISGLPAWLTANVEGGNLAPLTSQTIDFTVDPSTAVGNYETTLYLTGSQNIDAPLTVSLKVKGDEPDWSPVIDESYMMVIGQVNVNGTLSSDPDDILAAFRGEECVGLARPVYNSRFDSYIIAMSVYGNSSTNKSALTYKFYDASAGTIYPSVSVDEDSKEVFTWGANKIVGSFLDKENFVIFNPENKIEQDLSLNRKGWKWFSMYVTPDDNTLGSVFKNAINSIQTVKNSAESSSIKGESRVGTLTELSLNTMYKLKATESFAQTVVGVAANPANVTVTLNDKWTWIGYPVPASNSLAAAFAGADPNNGDVVMSQTAFAMYSDGAWLGTLTSMMPGEGYKYFSNAGSSKDFTYPMPSAGNRQNLAKSIAFDSTERFCLDCENNMAVVAQVVQDGKVVTDAKVSVYSADELCGYSAADDSKGRHFITVGNNGMAPRLTFMVETSDGSYMLGNLIDYADDAIVGNVLTPFVINLDEATGINGIASGKAIARIELYDMTGSLLKVITDPSSLQAEGFGRNAAIKRVVYADGTVSVIKAIEKR